MDTHRRQRLTTVLEAEGLDALVATTTENVYYASGLRSISHALFAAFLASVAHAADKPQPGVPEKGHPRQFR